MNFSLDNFTNIATEIIKFINNGLVPLVFAVALIVFLFGMYQFFIAGGADEEKRSNGKNLAMWAVIGFVIMVSVWGLVNLITTTFKLDSDTAPCLPTFNGDCKKAGGA